MLCMPHPDSKPLTVFCAAPEDTERLAAQLAGVCPEGAVLNLRGELGAGKSAFARAFLRRLGVAGPIKSPTYTLIESYPLANGSAVHMDLYRIADPHELDYLALDGLMIDTKALLVEWPDIGFSWLPAADLCIDFATEEQGRLLRFSALTARAVGWLANAGLEPELNPEP
jgi:tRNA threonylcarbamoyladenosine biosynthesis protein TsaE